MVRLCTSAGIQSGASGYLRMNFWACLRPFSGSNKVEAQVPAKNPNHPRGRNFAVGTKTCQHLVFSIHGVPMGHRSECFPHPHGGIGRTDLLRRERPPVCPTAPLPGTSVELNSQILASKYTLSTGVMVVANHLKSKNPAPPSGVLKQTPLPLLI